MTTPSKAESLRRAIAARQVQAKDLKERVALLTGQLTGSARDADVLDELLGVETRLASTTAGISALEQALHEATEAERQALTAARKEQAQARVKDLVKQVGARRSAYAELQAAGDRFVEQVQAFIAEGAKLASEAGSVAVAFHGERVEHSEPLVRAASGTSGATAQAVATIIRRAVRAFGTGSLGPYIALNDFNSSPLTLNAAADQDLSTLKARLS